MTPKNPVQRFFVSFLTEEFDEEIADEEHYFSFAYIVLRLIESGAEWQDAVEMTAAFFDEGMKFGLPDGFTFVEGKNAVIYRRNHD